jgi:hypothetical protein
MSTYPPARPAAQGRLWLHLLLFLLTLLTATALGARLAQNFRADLPPFDLEHDWRVFGEILHSPAVLLDGLAYSLNEALAVAKEIGSL